MATQPSSPATISHTVRTVLGDIASSSLGITDGHNHIWIDAVSGAHPSSPVLNQYEHILNELKRYRAAGGSSLLDCQPGGCGRDGNRLYRLSKLSGVNIIACTGFHRRRYYAADAWLFQQQAEDIASHFIKELTESLDEIQDRSNEVRAGFIKLALEAEWEETPQTALEGAAIASSKTGAMIEIHTEKGAQAEHIIPYFEKYGVKANRLVICHIDKRPDFSLHAELAGAGAMLEYDTFYRPKYQPETNLWPLLKKMVGAGLSDRVVLATDMAESAMYRTISGGPGLESLPGEIRCRLRESRFPEDTIQQMIGGNIAMRLAGLN